MDKKILSQNLLNNNFNLTEYKNYEKTFGDLSLNVTIYSSLFGKVKMVGIFYKFKKELEENFHDEVWDKASELLDQPTSSLILGSLGFDYIEANIIDKNVLNNINADIISEYCNKFANLIKPTLDEYGL